MSRERKGETFRIPKITRIHPQDELQHHHRHRHVHVSDHMIVRPPQAMNYTIRSPPPLSIIESNSDRSDMDDSETESVEVITVPPPVVHRSRSMHHREPTHVIITPKPMSVPLSPYRPYIVTTTTPTHRIATRTPLKTMMIEEIVTPEKHLPNNKSWCSCEPKSSTAISVLIAALSLFLAIIITAIIVLTIFLTMQQPGDPFSSQSSISSACSANCMMELTPFPPSTIAFWPFDGSLSDLNNLYSALYTSTSSVPYADGNMGQAVSFSGSDYLYSGSQFLNLSYQSWTIEAWLLITDLTADRGIFGQCESPSATDRCLSLAIKNKRLYLGFNNDDLSGVTVISTSSVMWHHVAFVYDYTNMRQSIYWDGVLEASTSPSGIGVGPYRGSSGQTTIGWVNGTSAFRNKIDHVSVTSGAKSACQILNDATLTAYYPFDVSGSFLDYSMNIFHGVANSLITLTGRVKQAYAFQDSSSYFQSMAFTAYEPEEPFSVSLWVKPHNVNGGTLIHISTLISGASRSCFDLLGFGITGRIVGQVFNYYDPCCVNSAGTTICPCQGTANVGGPVLPVNSWTHIVLTYSRSNGVALYTNGTLQDIFGPFSSFPASTPDYKSRPYMTVGNPTTTTSNPNCLIGTPSLFPAAYQGIIDELRVYSRELSKNEICSLYHV